MSIEKIDAMTAEERRRLPRFPFHSKGELSLGLMAYRGALLDISLFGALFEAGLFHFNIAPGDACRLKILTLGDESMLAVDGEVAHVRKNLIGVRFHPLDEGGRRKLAHIGTLNLAPQKVFDRKLPFLLQAWMA